MYGGRSRYGRPNYGRPNYGRPNYGRPNYGFGVPFLLGAVASQAFRPNYYPYPYYPYY